MREIVQLGDWLAQLPEQQLARLLERRGVTAADNCYQLAEQLLKPASLRSAFALLPSSTVAALQDTAADACSTAVALCADSHHAAAIGALQLGMLHPHTGRLFTAAATVFQQLPANASATPSTAVTQPLLAAQQTAWAHALTLSSQLAAICVCLSQQQPAVCLTRQGKLAKALQQQLADQLQLAPERVAALVALGQLAGVIANTPLTTPLGAGFTNWFAQAPAARWEQLAHALTNLFAATRLVLPEPPDRCFPLASAATRQRLALFSELAADLGIAFSAEFIAHAEAASRKFLASGDFRVLDDTYPPLFADYTQHFPPPLEQFICQPDFSVLTQGPLTPEAEKLLALIAVPEHAGIASSYRLTEASLRRAVRRGLTPQQLRTQLEIRSLTGVPQPIAYLLDQLTDEDSERQRAVNSSETAAHTRATADSAPIRVQTPYFADCLQLAKALKAQTQPHFPLVQLAIRHRAPLLFTIDSSTGQRTLQLLPVSTNGRFVRLKNTTANNEMLLPVNRIVAVEFEQLN